MNYYFIFFLYRCLRQANQMQLLLKKNLFYFFIVVVARSQDSIQPLLVVVQVAYMLDNFVPDDSFVDDSRHV